MIFLPESNFKDGGNWKENQNIRNHFFSLFLLSTYQNYHLLFDFDKKGRNKTTELLKNTADEISQVES